MQEIGARTSGEEPLYLFCFARKGALKVQGSGVDGQHPLCIFQHSPELCAVLSQVAVEEFCGPEAEQRMQQLAWVGPRAFRHEAVIEEVMAQSAVLPLRFGTLFSSLPALREFMEAHSQAIGEFLRRVAGHGEWSVKGILDRRRAEQRVLSLCLSAQQEHLAAMSDGMRYFVEQRIRNNAQKELNCWLDHTSQRLARELAGQAVEFRECQVVGRQGGEQGAEEVLNWAFLLPCSDVLGFRQHIDRVNADLGGQGLRLELSGPWPPFRFVPALSMAGMS